MIDENLLKIMGSVDVDGGNGTCQTVKIVNPHAKDEYIIINEADFDSQTMTLFKE